MHVRAVLCLAVTAVLATGCVQRPSEQGERGGPKIEVKYTKEFLAILAKRPAMVPGDSPLKQPPIPKGLKLRPSFPPIPDPEPLPDRGAGVPPDLEALPPAFEGFERGPYIPLPTDSAEELPTVLPFVVGDFYLCPGPVRSLSNGAQASYEIPNEEELTYSNNHHRIIVTVDPTSDNEFRYEVLFNGVRIAEVSHENVEMFYTLMIPVPDNFSVLLVHGPGNTQTLTFKGTGGSGNVKLCTVCFDYHKRVRLALEE